MKKITILTFALLFGLISCHRDQETIPSPGFDQSVFNISSGSDTLIIHTQKDHWFISQVKATGITDTTYHLEKDRLDGKWFKIDKGEKVIMISIDENHDSQTRSLVITVCSQLNRFDHILITQEE